MLYQMPSSMPHVENSSLFMGENIYVRDPSHYGEKQLCDILKYAKTLTNSLLDKPNEIRLCKMVELQSNGLSTKAYDLAECRADLAWISKTRMLVHSKLYCMRFPDIRGYPEEDQLHQTLQATVSAAEQAIIQDIEFHLQSKE